MAHFRARTQTRVQSGLILLLLALLSLPSFVVAEEADRTEPRLRRLVSPDVARLTVRREACRCQPLVGQDEDILLLTLGAETVEQGETHFHPIASFAFDRTLDDSEAGEWLSLWTYGTAGASAWDHLRSFLPVPYGAPSAGEKKLARLDARLEEIRDQPAQADLDVPKAVVHRADLGRYPFTPGLWNWFRRGLSWADAYGPAQFVYRSYLLRRKDRSERNFQRTYLSLLWLLDHEFSGQADAPWLETLTDLRFHLLRNRSSLGSWIEHADSVALVYNYESNVRRQLAKSSSWMQSAANEHLLGYQPLYRYSANGTPVPFGGILYYDPSLQAVPDPGWWKEANPFDLPYNPHRHPQVRRLAQEHPDELIPLAIYTFQTNLALRPIIVVDFFAPSNPRTRESTQQLMVLAKQWIAIATGSLELERWPYRLTAWAANKKSFTLLVDKSSRQGIEELRLALEAGLYFDPEVRSQLLERVDQRVLNPLLEAAPVEERLAHIQFESLRARDHQPLCDQVQSDRRKLAQRLRVPQGLSPEEHARQLALRLEVWRHQVRLSDFVAEPLGDLGSLGSLQEPLRFFLTSEPLDPRRFEKLIEKLYAKLYLQHLRLPSDRRVPELEATLALTEEVWQHTAAPDVYAKRRPQLESELHRRNQKGQAENLKEQRQVLHEFLEQTETELKRARRAGCDRDDVFLPRLEARLAIVREVLETAARQEHLRPELDDHSDVLMRRLDNLRASFDQCPDLASDPWFAETRLYLEQLTPLLAGAKPVQARAAGVRRHD